MQSISLYITLICPTNYNVKFDPLIVVMLASSLHGKIILSPFIINEYFVGKSFETTKISYCSSNFHPLGLVFIDILWLNNYNDGY